MKSTMDGTAMDRANKRLAKLRSNLARTIQTLQVLINGLSELDEELQNLRTIAENYLIMAGNNGAFAIKYLAVVEEDVLVEALTQADSETLEKLIQALRRVNLLDEAGI